MEGILQLDLVTGGLVGNKEMQDLGFRVSRDGGFAAFGGRAACLVSGLGLEKLNVVDVAMVLAGPESRILGSCRDNGKENGLNEVRHEAQH